MLIKMLKTAKGSTNGIAIVEYEEGKEYELPERLSSVFVDQMKVAVRVVKEFKLPPVEEKEVVKEEKMVEESPKNKAIETVPDNKTLSKNGRKRLLSRR